MDNPGPRKDVAGMAVFQQQKIIHTQQQAQNISQGILVKLYKSTSSKTGNYFQHDAKQQQINYFEKVLQEPETSQYKCSSLYSVPIQKSSKESAEVIHPGCRFKG